MPPESLPFFDPPATRSFARLVGAQVFPILFTAMLIPWLVYDLTFLLQHFLPEWPRADWFQWTILGVLLLFPGLVLALVQKMILGDWITRPLGWLAASSLVLAVLLPLMLLVLSQLLDTSEYTGQIAGLSDWNDLPALLAWSTVSGAVGLAGGLLFGLAQSLCLGSRKWRWWLVTALAWALALPTVAHQILYIFWLI